MVGLERNGSGRDGPGLGGWQDRDGDGAGGTPGLLAPDTAVGPARVTACEGEHWDGQDAVGPREHDGDVPPACYGQRVDLQEQHASLALAQCPDPARARDVEVTAPAGARVSLAGGDGAGGAYAAARASGVATVALFAGGCLAGGATPARADRVDAPCAGDVGHGAFALYAQDDAPFGTNVIARLLHAPWMRPPVAERDCTAHEYDEDARVGGEPRCFRDNTALTLELIV